MKLNFEQLLQIKEGLVPLLDKKLSIKLSYKIMKIQLSIDKEIDHFFNPKLKEIFTDVGATPTEDGQGMDIPKDKIDEFSLRYKELLNFEVEIPDYNIKLEELEETDLTPIDLIKLDKLITE